MAAIPQKYIMSTFVAHYTKWQNGLIVDKLQKQEYPKMTLGRATMAFTPI